MGLFVGFYGLMLGGICRLVAVSYADGQIMVWAAWLITFALVVSLTFYAYRTKSDFTIKGNQRNIYILRWLHSSIINADNMLHDSISLQF